MNSVDFGMATIHIKRDANNVITRKGWNGKGMYVKLCRNTNIEIDGAMKALNDHFVIKNVNGSFSTWVPSVDDTLETDWECKTLNDFKGAALTRGV